MWGLASTLLTIDLMAKSGNIVILGLDNAGKTTLLQALDTGGGRPGPIQPSTGTQELTVDGLKFATFDLGGLTDGNAWKRHFPMIDAIVFMIDCGDFYRFQEAESELNAVLYEVTVQDVPILILCNKMEVTGAVSESVARQYFGLNGVTTGKDNYDTRGSRPMELFMVSVLRRQGFKEAFNWLSYFL